MSATDPNLPPPFNGREPSIRIVTDSPIPTTRLHPSPWQWVRICVLLAIVVGLSIYAWPILTGIRAENLEQQWAMDWVYENEGDPGSVRFIELLGPHMGVVYTKYRCTGPFGGPVVEERCFRVRDDGIECSPHSVYSGPEAPKRPDYLGGIIRNLLNKD